MIVTALSAINVTGVPLPTTLVAASPQFAGTRQMRYPFRKILTSQSPGSYPPEYLFGYRGAISRAPDRAAATL
ncbi:hypothetical protein GCM10007979_23180 [Nocardioides albus]|nr:hypothetical protein GCM10007979_23180 [Nocardioides albus]